MKLSNIHTHTTYSDGIGSIRENIDEALQCGFVSLGISDHSYTDYEDICLKRDAETQYISEIRHLASEYSGQIEIYCGIELDSNSVYDTSAFDYVIASVHSLKINEEYYPVDFGENAQRQLIERFFNGNEVEFSKRYYDELYRHVSHTLPDVVGHFDLITKYNSIDEESREYRDTALKALRETARFCNRFEVNTGGMSRGYKKHHILQNFCSESFSLSAGT